MTACWAVVVAAGSGRRMGAELPKQYLDLGGRTVLEHTVSALASFSELAGMVVVHSAEDLQIQRIQFPEHLPVYLTPGGAERADSVRAGLAKVAQHAQPEDWVMVHDAARPCLEQSDLRALYRRCIHTGEGAILARPVADTLKRSGDSGDGSAVAATVDRSNLWCAQTPQMFPLGALQQALDSAAKRHVIVTDEASAIEATGGVVQLVKASPRNIKITVPEDLELARQFLGIDPQAQHQEQAAMRIGHGYDVHRFGPGGAVVLGGVSIPHTAGLEAHSDGDVLLHALCDAMLGAVGAGDIGRHFPDTDAANAGIDSRVLLRRVLALVHERGWRPANVDSTLVAQAPKMAPHIDSMCGNIASDLEIDVSAVNVKATTTERLGFAGREEGIAAYAVVCLEPLHA